MSTQYRVQAPALNFRSTPNVTSGNIIAVLFQGQIVNKLQGTENDHWWKVSTQISTQTLQGFVARNHLSEITVPTDSVTPTGGVIPEVHLEKSSLVARSQTSGRAFALNESDQPTRTTPDPAKLTAIINWLKVEQSNRYKRRPDATFCNIYAYDYAYLAKAFLPRVWWTSKAILDLKANKQVPISYGQTVRELNANSIFDWFEDYGNDFGWVRVFDLTELQDAANQGQVCIISAQRKNLNKSGHICAVVPEISGETAIRQGTRVIEPLQSQAGATNFAYGTSTWWTASKFRSFGFWKHA